MTSCGAGGSSFRLDRKALVPLSDIAFHSSDIHFVIHEVYFESGFLSDIVESAW